jgi:hypothetical protein
MNEWRKLTQGKSTRNKDNQDYKVKKKPWHWDSNHWIAFDNAQNTIAKEVVLAYLDFTKPFDTYTDAFTNQLGAVITQDNRPFAFFSWKLSGMQSKYTSIDLELLAIIISLMDFCVIYIFCAIYSPCSSQRDTGPSGSDTGPKWRYWIEK